MNLVKLFETQKVLRDRINYNEQDRFDKLVLALQVELAECANEQRTWKFWSQDQEPRTLALRKPAMMEEDKVYYNPLLDEYVDGLHFVLELGIEKGFSIRKTNITNKTDNVTNQFNNVYNAINYFVIDACIDTYFDLVRTYLGLGEMLGFTWEQIEAAYYEKNQINHTRQANGY
ncbi:dUTP diphosphatase [Peribacillus loiseleuriae]|uniref:dUTP diphosphatase n=1 Tax=Peribacillus loiseleuriae TaxID=1679170 RepID=UPI003817242B